MVPLRPLIALLPLAALLSSCGAGLIAGVFGGSSGGGETPPPTVVPPSLAMANPRAPLVAPPNSVQGRNLLVNSFSIPSTAALRVELHRNGLSEVQAPPDPFLRTSTAVVFVERHGQIFTGDPTADDVLTQLYLFVDGVQIGSPLDFTLIRQREVTLDPGPTGGTTALVSVLGTSRLHLKVAGRVGEGGLPNPRIEIFPASGGSSVATGVLDTPDPNGIDRLLSGVVPANPYPEAVVVAVVDDLAGFSTIVTDVFYRPEIFASSPGFGSTVGGEQLVLIGQGMAPLSGGVAGAPPDFSQVQIEFEKGGRVLTVPGTQISAARSSFGRLVFLTPQSPDGRPGEVVVRLKIQLAIEVEDDASDVFVYRRPNPGFGPRGALLTSPATATGLTVIEGATPDALVVSSAGGFPRVEILLSEDNGMFSTFGPPIEAGRQQQPSQVLPMDVCAEDFDGDGDSDVVVLNAGDQSGSLHSVLEGQAAPLPPLDFSTNSPMGANGPGICVTGDFNGDALPDFVEIPTSGSMPRPRLYRTDATSGSLAFAGEDITGIIADRAPYEAAAAAHLDDDGLLDLVCVKGGAAMELIVAYGTGTGAFTDERQIALAVPGYVPDPGSLAVSVHALGSVTPRPLAVVLAGLDASSATPPTVAALMPMPAGRGYDQPTAQTTVSFPLEAPVVASAHGDLDDGNPDDIVIAGSGAPELRLLKWSGSSLSEVVGGVASALEPLGSILSVAIDLAAPADGQRIPSPVQGVFVHHVVQTATGAEDRISTWLAAPGPSLVPPDASLMLPEPAEGITLGNFSGQLPDRQNPRREARDLCVGSALGLQFLANDGLGGFAVQQQYSVMGLLPTTLTSVVVPNASDDAVAFFQADGQLGVLVPGDPVATLSQTDLRSYSTPTARVWDVNPISRLIPDDVDLDGFADLTVMLALDEPGGVQTETVLLLLRGNASAASGQFPYLLPDGPAQAVTMSERAVAVTTGDFAQPDGVPSTLEVALALPVEGNHVRFYRYDAGTPSPTDARFVRSFVPGSAQALIAGEEPGALAAGDFDGNGTVDLVVASGGDSRLRLFLNSGEISVVDPTQVNIRAFVESASPAALPPGTPMAALLGDFDGDEFPDVLVATRNLLPEKDNNLGCYLGSGTGVLNGLRLLSSFRSGNVVQVPGGVALRDADMFPAMADLNWDGLLDVVVGWSTAGAGDRNLRVLFGSAR